ncbi:c-type cytochrome [Devosia sp.]|uniref:c-type cytochrome n=1 Tax=Devosia sp. TaxID=1871048 RepID=UPI003A9212C7
MLRFALFAAAGLIAGTAYAEDVKPTVDMGARIAVVGGCHDCHTVNYAETGGEIDPAAALTGSPVGYQGPWGTTYAKNLRITATQYDEDSWVEYLSTFQAGPPMPWFNVHAFTEAEMRSLYMYIKSLGEPGDPTPESVPPGEMPTTPYIVFAPPQMPG